MSFSDVHPGDPIDAVNVQQVIDALKGTAGKGVPLSPTAVNNATNYALTVENLESTNSRALNVLKSDGSTLIKADATGVTLGSPITAPAASLPGSVLQNASVPNAALGPDVARANLLVNGGFEIWQRGAGPFTASGAYHADRWTLALTGSDTLSVSRDTTNMDAGSASAAACTFTLSGGTGTNIGQSITDNPQLNTRAVSLSVRVRTTVANAVRIVINDGTPVYSSFHSGGGTYQTLTVSKTISAATFGIQVLFAASCTAYLDNAMLVVGSQPANYVPLHPADDLARCLRYYEIAGNEGSILWAGWAGAASEALGFTLRWKAQKAVSPTVTRVGTWSVGNCGQPTAGTSGVDGFQLYAQSSAANGHTQFASSTSAYITGEANP